MLKEICFSGCGVLFASPISANVTKSLDSPGLDEHSSEPLLSDPQVYIEKQKGEILGVVIVESGWGSILPTVIIASLMHGGPAEKSGRLNIGDQIMTINGTSLVGLPLSTCQSIIKVRRSDPARQRTAELLPALVQPENGSLCFFFFPFRV